MTDAILLLSAVFATMAALDLIIGNRMVRTLLDVSLLAGNIHLRVSIIVPARNEQRNIREALQSLLELNYPDYELIVVDDRSEDGTGQILDEIAATSSRLKVIHIDQLPKGWLGKNHALWVGSKRATGDLLLFTDADIIMEPTVLTRAVHFLERHKIDHLAATPSMRMPTTFLSMFSATFIIFFSLFIRPWKVRDAKSRYHIGIGAFNLVRREVYRQIGGHETIRMRPDDDIKLGKIVKKAGFRQDVVYAPKYLAVEWYSTVKEAIKGLEKNAFSGADYSITLVLVGITFHILCSFWPLLAVFITHGIVRAIYIATVTLTILTYADSARFHNSKAWYAIGYPITSALLVYIILRTMILNLSQGGIYWRDTFYSLKELRANKV